MQGLNIYTRGAFGRSMNNLEQMAHVYVSFWNTSSQEEAVTSQEMTSRDLR